MHGRDRPRGLLEALLTHLSEWNFPENPSKFLYAYRATLDKLHRLWGPNNRQAIGVVGMDPRPPAWVPRVTPVRCLDPTGHRCDDMGGAQHLAVCL